MKPSCKVLKSPSKNHKTPKISNNIFIFFITLILFSSFSATIIHPGNAYAAKKNVSAVKSGKNSKHNNASMSKNNKKASANSKKISKKNDNRSKKSKNKILTNSTGNKRTAKKNTCIISKNKTKNSRNISNNRKLSRNSRNIARNDKRHKVIAKKQNTRSEDINEFSQNDSEVRIRHVSGIVKTSLHKTAAKMGLNRKLTNQLSTIFKNTPALSKLCKGDLVQVAYQEKYVNGKLAKTGVITSAIITSKDKTYHAYRFTYNGKRGYYDEKGNSLESSFLKVPLRYKEITSGFSSRRFHPIKHIFQPHNGIDYSASTGTPIKSVGNGTVIFKGYDDSAGNYIKIKHPGIGISEYMHMSKFASSIKVNSRVSKGDVIGYVGNTGYSTGPHLHLGFMVNNEYVDYSKLKLPRGGEALPKKFRNLFLQHVAMVNKQWNKAGRRELSFNNNTYSVTTPM